MSGWRSQLKKHFLTEHQAAVIQFSQTHNCPVTAGWKKRPSSATLYNQYIRVREPQCCISYNCYCVSFWFLNILLQYTYRTPQKVQTKCKIAYLESSPQNIKIHISTSSRYNIRMKRKSHNTVNIDTTCVTRNRKQTTKTQVRQMLPYPHKTFMESLVIF